jgi:hypothetical protein
VVADITRGDLCWATEARLSLKDIQVVEMDSFVTHIVRVGESLKKQGEVTVTKMEDFGHFFKLGHTILTDKSVPYASVDRDSSLIRRTFCGRIRSIFFSSLQFWCFSDAGRDVILLHQLSKFT